MKFDIPKIEYILNSVNKDIHSDDWEFNKGLCWKKWNSDFFGKNSNNLKIDRDLSFVERMNKMKKFRETNQSEKSFKKLYPNFKYYAYKSPWDFNYKMVSTSKIQKVAFELQIHIPLEYNQLCELVRNILRRHKREDWNFDTLSTSLMSYDKDLYLKSRIYIQMRKQDLVA